MNKIVEPTLPDLVETAEQEANLPAAQEREYETTVARERIKAARAVLAAYLRGLDKVEGKLDAEDANLEQALAHLNGHSQKMNGTLAELHGGAAELKIRRRVVKTMFPPPGPETTPEPTVAPDFTGESTVEAVEKPGKAAERKPRPLTTAELWVRVDAKLAEEEAAESRRYQDERSALLKRLKASETPQAKQAAIENLNRCEANYARIHRDFQNGKREKEIWDQEFATNARLAERANSERNQPKKPQPPKQSQLKKSTVQRPQPRRQGKKVSAIDLALRAHAREEWEKAQRARELRDLGRQARMHPFKTYNTQDERLFQTSGFINRRAKRNPQAG